MYVLLIRPTDVDFFFLFLNQHHETSARGPPRSIDVIAGVGSIVGK